VPGFCHVGGKVQGNEPLMIAFLSASVLVQSWSWWSWWSSTAFRGEDVDMSAPRDTGPAVELPRAGEDRRGM
jgi:hypothetical protein